ncbi:MAG: non-canonical purine NTP pyrophosphatase [Clostridia bacterium]|nr:non-canonical purine NTP pyrophosphatase [Clostridia bacterium]
MDVLFATHNKSKLKHYKSELEKLGINVLSLDDLNINYDVKEVSLNTRENAIKKATEYYQIAKIPTIAVDDGLFFENIPDKLQPGAYVRRIDGKSASTDEKLIEHYVDIVNQYGVDGKLNGKWVKGIAIAKSENDIRSLSFDVEKIFVSEVSSKRNEGYPLDSMSITPYFNKYTVDLTEEENLILKEKTNSKLIKFLRESFKRI